ncbi:MAG: uridine kinase [Spirochaetota bacterium]|nr:uridine kinase [Spirochaetota bacterium]
MKNIVIGIAGGTASGKTTIAQAIERSFSRNEVVILRQDNYYNSQDHITLEERLSTNYDHPNAFDFELLRDHLKLLSEGKIIEQPIYNFTTHTRSSNTHKIIPSRVIILEGILSFADNSLMDLMDIKVFIDTEADLRFIRRLLRDTVERGRTIEQSINQYLATAKPGHDQFIEPSKKKADIIIPYTDHNTVAIDMLIDHVRYIVSQNK